MLRNSILCSRWSIPRSGDRCADLLYWLQISHQELTFQSEAATPHCFFMSLLSSQCFSPFWWWCSFFSVIRDIFWLLSRGICDLGRNWVLRRVILLQNFVYYVLILGRLTKEVFLGCLVCTLKGIDLYLSGFSVM